MGDNALIIVAPAVPTPEAYDPSVITLTGWMEVFNEFCRLSNIQDEPVVPEGQPNPVTNKRSWFLKLIGMRNYEILRTASLPQLPHQKSITFLTNELTKRFESPSLVPVMRMEFHSRVQKPNEAIHEYISVLQDLASKCNFGDLNEMLRDQLIRGIRSDECRRKLLGETDLPMIKLKPLLSRTTPFADKPRLWQTPFMSTVWTKRSQPTTRGVRRIQAKVSLSSKVKVLETATTATVNAKAKAKVKVSLASNHVFAVEGGTTIEPARSASGGASNATS